MLSIRNSMLHIYGFMYCNSPCLLTLELTDLVGYLPWSDSVWDHPLLAYEAAKFQHIYYCALLWLQLTFQYLYLIDNIFAVTWWAILMAPYLIWNSIIWAIIYAQFGAFINKWTIFLLSCSTIAHYCSIIIYCLHNEVLMHYLPCVLLYYYCRGICFENIKFCGCTKFC